jgi:protein O-mannosyl-transferase
VPPGGTATAVALEERPEPRRGIAWWVYAVAVLAAVFIAFEVYGPALNGEFLFDDDYLPFSMPEVQNAPLRAWLGVRPFLMISYWLNYKAAGLEPYSYHAVGVVLHALNAVLVWLIVRRLLGRVGEQGTRRELLAGFAGGLFLLHPAQTESVAYVTSRSETMSIFFFLSAFAVFLYRKHDVISWGRMVAVLLLFGIACTVKEHTTVLPGLLLLADYYFTTPYRFEGIRRNAKLYVPILVGGALGVVAVWRVLSTADSAGFRIQDFTWYQYLFTQFRVIWSYVRLYVLPVGLNGDYQYPVSHTITEHGAIIGLIAIVAVSFAAWKYRRDYPLASFGWFGFLLLLARRLYLPFLCLLLMTLEFLRRWRTSPAILATVFGVVLATGAVASWQRNHVWSSALAFWSDAAEKSPKNGRAHFQLAYAQWKNGDCTAAVENYQKVAALEKPDDRLLVDWALALDCVDKPDEAVAKLREAAALAPSALPYAQIGMVYGKRNRHEEALAALAEAEKLDPRFDMTFVYRGNILAARGDLSGAVAWYKHALALNSNNTTARSGLAIAEQRLRQQR